MENKNQSEGFSYTYSAKQQEEIKNIQKKYMPQEESKMDKLRRLDKSAEKPGTTAAIVMGIIGTLLLGIGMSCTMVWSENFFVPGIIIGITGIISICLAYPVYSYITKKIRKKIAPQIMKLTEELMK